MNIETEGFRDYSAMKGKTKMNIWFIHIGASLDDYLSWVTVGDIYVFWKKLFLIQI